MEESPDTRIAKHTAALELPQVSSEEKRRAYVRRGMAYGEKGLYHEAIADYTAALALPHILAFEAGAALLNRGAAYGLIGETEKEIADYSFIISHSDFSPHDRARAFYNRAVAYQELGRTEEAITDYTVVIAMPDEFDAGSLLNPSLEDRMNSRINRAWAYDKCGKVELAIADCSEVIGAPGASPDQKARALLTRGVMMANNGQTEAALADLSTIIAMPDAPLKVRTSAEKYQREITEKAAVEHSAGAQDEPKSGCFVATACYDSPDCAEISVLRQFRDEAMMPSSLGRTLMALYYRLSPPIAELLHRHAGLRVFVRERIVSPIVKLIEKT